MNPKEKCLSRNNVANYNKCSDVRYDAYCPCIIEITFVKRKLYIALTGMIVNISVTGLLFSSERTPWSTVNINEGEASSLDIIDENCHIYIPWVNIHSAGKIRRVRSFLIGVEFDKALKADMVKLIAKLEPNENRRFKPKNPQKYNRIIPLTPTES